MNMKKFFINCYSGLIRNRDKRRAVRQVLLDTASSLNEDFVVVGGFLDLGDIDWQTYLLTHNLPEKVSILRSGLGEKSNQLLDLIFSRMTIFPKGNHRPPWNYKIRVSAMQLLSSPDELADAKAFFEELPQYHVDFPVDGREYTPDIFFYHCGLRNKNNKLKKYIAGKDFIDGGAYVGDSALLYISHYAPRCVYSFEISEKNSVRYENTMRINKIHTDRYKFFRIGLSDKKSEIMMEDTGGVGASVLDRGNSKVQLTDLDSFAIENNLHIGFIKADLEGVGLEATLGMAETIKRDRPVINIAMYHNPKEFFEIKPTLEKITDGLNYNITIERHHPFNDCATEIVVFACPKELE